MRLCVFGDSFVNGTGDDDGLGWVGRLCAAERRAGADVTLYNLGVRRDTSQDVLGRWLREARARLPPGCGGRLVFSFGLNDCAMDDNGDGPRVAHETTVANAAAILAEASAWLPTLMVGPPPVTDSAERNAQVCALSEDLAALCRELGAPFVGTTEAMSTLYPVWRLEAEAGDGIHPNRRSYALLAEWVRTSFVWREWIGS